MSTPPSAPPVADLGVHVLAWTTFDALLAHQLTGWRVDDDAVMDDGQALAEFAGRACYQSWAKPNPATATNAGYLEHILDVGHLSVLEHGTATMYFTGVSRSLTHELIRHRHFSYSQLSQRYVPEHDAAVVEPDIIASDPYLHGLFEEATRHSIGTYAQLVHALERKLQADTQRHQRAPLPPSIVVAEVAARTGSVDTCCAACGESWPCRASQMTATARRKMARQAARAVLPNATETRIVVTGNYRAWRHFITMRATEHADVEIRELAVRCLGELHRVAPNVFADFTTFSLPDGTLAARTPHQVTS